MTRRWCPRTTLPIAGLALALVATTPAARAAEELDGRTFYFGELHAHTGMSGDGGSTDLGNCKVGGCGNFADYFDNARYGEGLDFAAITDHINGYHAMQPADWATTLDLVAAANDPGNGFVAILGAELWVGLPNDDRLGHWNYLFFADDVTLDNINFADLSAAETPSSETCTELWAAVAALDATVGPLLLIPHHPAVTKPAPTVWECHDPNWAVAVEVYSTHGNSMFDPAVEAFDLPFWGVEPDRTIDNVLSFAGYGYQIGLIGGTDHHDSWPGAICDLDLIHENQLYGGSLTGVFVDAAEPYGRQAIHGALRSRHTLATTGPQIPVLLSLSSKGGEEIAVSGEVFDTVPGGSATLRVRFPEAADPYVQTVEIHDSYGSTLTLPRIAAGRYELELPGINAPWYAYADVHVDGASWWADQGLTCVDGGDNTVERIWTSPLWLEVADDVDDDGDGFSEADGDCDDSNPAIHPGADELPNGVDDDCDGDIDEGTTAEDADGDGYSELDGDCDDGDTSVYPGAPILCDGIADNNCDGEPDAGERDEDGDGVTGCDGDCDDSDAAVYPEAEDFCDDVADNNCDHVPDPLEVDDDGDGYSECEGDCDDELDWVFPAAPEYPNGIDDDCDGDIDEGFEEQAGCAPFASGLPFCSLGSGPATPRGVVVLLALAALLTARRRARG
jgi:Putative metal-binding motif